MACSSNPCCQPLSLPWPAGRLGLAVLAVCIACAPAALSQTLVLEDFEKLPARATVQAVTQGKGVTHGQQAALLRAGSSVVIKLTSLDPNTVDWLKLDSLNSLPMVQPLVLSFRNPAGSSIVRLVGHVQPGSDTLALPISTFVRYFGGTWPGALTSVELTNPGPEPVTIDYVRGEPATAAPPQSVLVDYGPAKQFRWPGFQLADRDDSSLTWDIPWRAGANSRVFPDGLTGDYLGPTDCGTAANLTIRGPGSAAAFAWVWLTHDFRENFPPTEYAFQVSGKTILQNRLTSKQFFGEEGLMRGRGGAWTAEWYAKDFSDQLCSQVGFALGPGANRVKVLNCQFAALAIAPLAQKQALKGYVDQVNQDLQRYRRQFMVATRRQAICTIQPTARQQQAGMMVFEPRTDRPFEPAWVPEDANEVERLQCTVASGQMALVSLAVMPTRPIGYLSPSVETLSGPAGVLKTSAQGSEAWVLEPIPNAYEGTVEFVPWLLHHRAVGPEKDEIVHVAVAIWVSEAAEDGLYKGNVLLSSNSGIIRVPLELKVVHVGGLSKCPTFLPAGTLYGTRLWGGLGSSLSKPQAALWQRGMYTQLSPSGLNAFWVSAPVFRRDLPLSEAEMTQELQEIPPKLIAGRWMINLRSICDSLRYAEIRSGSQVYRSTMAAAISRCQALAKKSGLPEPLYYFSHNWDAKTIVGQNVEAAALAGLGAKLAMWASSGVIADLTPEDRRACLKNYAALVMPDSDTAAEVIRLFKGTDKDRLVLLEHGHPERYAVGFRSAALGADGGVVGGLLPSGPVYDGMGRLGNGFVVAESEKTMISTLGMLTFRQGADDMILWKQCEEALAKADKAGQAGVEVDQLRSLMAGIQKQILSARSNPTAGGLADTKITPRQLDQWRMSLIGQLEVQRASQARK